jgi:hypothetical protein
VFERKWREYFFWQPYTDSQLENLGKLCIDLFKTVKIKQQIIEHNTKINGIEKFAGVVSRSNFNTLFTDVNPAFSFDEFLKKIENE